MPMLVTWQLKVGVVMYILNIAYKVNTNLENCDMHFCICQRHIILLTRNVI